MSLEEVLENARLSSISEEDITFEPVRNMRAPHHTSSRPSIFGGGCKFSNIIRIIQIYLDYFQIYLDSLNNILIILFKFKLLHRIYYAQ